jgi:hypothetical protein
MSGAPAPAAGEALRRIAAMLLTVALGGAGGYAFLQMKTPLPWMMGAMCVSTVLALAGAPLRPPGRLRDVMIAVIGLMVGSAFSPEIVAQAGEWLPSIAAILAYSAAMIVGLGWLLRRVGGYDPATAFCSAAPGGFTEMILLGGSMGGDMRTISLMHSVRVVITVITIPFWFRFVHDYTPSGTAALGSVSDLSAGGAAALAVSAVIGYGLARLARVPLPALIGPMAAAALVHALGFSTAHPPGEVVALAQVVIGVGVGCRFLGSSLRRIAGVLRAAAIMAVLMLVVAILCAAGLHLLTGLPFEALLLAFAPGGVAEMNVITVSLHIDPAFVATHHLVRLAFLMVVAPLVLKLFGSRWAALPPSKTEPAE